MSEENRVVASDPFWSVVRRRHPDLDIVLLPPAAPTAPAIPADAPLRDPAAVAAAQDDELAALWHALAGEHDPSRTDARWLPGADPRTVRREATWLRDAVPPATALELLVAAPEALAADGWQVFVPPTGLPRVMAGRDAGLGREELQLLHVEGLGRLVLRVRSADEPIGEPAARALLLDADA